MDSVVEDVRNKGTMERKRCLPPWMLGITAGDKEKSSMKQDNVCSSVDDKQHLQVGQSELVSGGINKSLVLPPVKDANGEIIKRIRKSTKRIIENGNMLEKHEEESERKKKSKRVITGEENNAQNSKRRSKAYVHNSSGSSARLPSSQSCSDIELSLDDLVSIAEEYVRAEAEKEGEQGAGNGLPCKTSSGQLISRHETKSEEVHIGVDFIKEGSIENDGLPIENMPSAAPLITGNAAEHMLNIFLGPAVWKPQEHKKLELAEYIPQSHKLSENLNRVTVEGEEAPLVKKTVSLKEKIAMFLD